MHVTVIIFCERDICIPAANVYLKIQLGIIENRTSELYNTIRRGQRHQAIKKRKVNLKKENLPFY